MAALILSAHQPNFLPYAGYFEKIAKSDLFVLFDDVSYDPNDFINRNKIKTHNGWQWITVPVLHKGYQQNNLKIKDVEIDTIQSWQRKILKSITLSYQKAPYFDKYFPELRDIIYETIDLEVTTMGDKQPKYIKQGRWIYLAELNETLIRWLCERLGITTKIVKASDYSFQGQKSGLVLDMCLQLGCSRYIFGAQGKDYADIESFNKAGIELEFQDYQCKPYNQLHGEFISRMSVLDLLFLCGPNSLGIIRGE